MREGEHLHKNLLLSSSLYLFIKFSMTIKDLLSHIPYSAEVYDALRPGRPRTRYNLEQLREHLPAAVNGWGNGCAEKAAKPKRIVLFATLHYWVEQAAIVALALRGMGHDVTIAYLPYGDWRKEINAFDLRRQDLYTRRVLKPLAGLVKSISLLDIAPAAGLPSEVEKAVESVSAYDAMYTNQEENVDINGSLYRLRLARNRQAARAALRLLTESRPDSVLIPNGTITELGAVYRGARHLEIDTVTYEFNDQREQIWIARNDEVMRQNTDLLWAARGGRALTPEEREKIEALEAARMGGRAFGKSARKWQDVETVGGEKIRADLGLDSRPIVLLATNVLGDSLTLGRNIFAASMAEWITRTAQFFAGRADAQLLIRVHPGERLTHGKSMVDVVREALPELPENIRVIAPLEKINTYDLMDIAALGLVYTTTTGMEMALRGLPVIACGETHYRRRGFTLDPQSYDEYFGMVEKMLSGYSVVQLSAQPENRLTEKQVETAWEYAYRFFFEYPFSFPWRLMHFWKDYELWPLARILSAEGRAEFGKAFDYLAGEPLKYE
ncbi:MAG: hypothetical protein OHK0031_11790 [Anaerolineales bacterium]